MRQGDEALLTADEERELAGRIAAGDDDARHELVRRNLPLVTHIARRLPRWEQGIQDMVQSGVIGLYRAVDLFDPDKGRFSTYAGYWIRQSIRREQILGQLVRSPQWTVEVNSRAGRIAKRMGEDATPERMALEMGISACKLAMAASGRRRMTVEADCEFRGMVLVEADEIDLGGAIDADEEMARVMSAVGSLQDPRTREALLRCVGGGEPLRTLADEWGCTPERVRQLKKCGLAAVRKKLGVNGPRPDLVEIQ